MDELTEVLLFTKTQITPSGNKWSPKYLFRDILHARYGYDNTFEDCFPVRYLYTAFRLVMLYFVCYDVTVPLIVKDSVSTDGLFTD